MGKAHSLYLQTSSREEGQNCAWINVEHSVVALRSKLDVKFYWEGNEETVCPCLLHSEGRILHCQCKKQLMNKKCGTWRPNFIFFTYDYVHKIMNLAFLVWLFSSYHSYFTLITTIITWFHQQTGFCILFMHWGSYIVSHSLACSGCMRWIAEHEQRKNVVMLIWADCGTSISQHGLWEVI